MAPGQIFSYAVTNWHVACQDGASVLRINTHAGEPDIYPFDPAEWVYDPRYDIAVMPFSVNKGMHKLHFIGTGAFVTQEKLKQANLSVGEDVFMIGRFIDHDGGIINNPAVRFGNISVMPSPIEQPNGYMADSYCIDLHSRTGYSGSPVFVYRTAGYDLGEALEPENTPKLLISGLNYFGFLGIHYAQFPEEWELRQGSPAKKPARSSVPLIRDGAYVRGLSGMTCVLPAWTILEVLDLPKLRHGREATNKMLEEKLARAGRRPPEPEG